jgi:hypothetical protein
MTTETESRSEGDEPLAGAVASPTSVATPALTLQILSTEHWSLLASRGLAWNETFSRTSMFLSTLSFATVALALVAQATGFNDTFRLFALTILPVVLLLGISTQLRLESSNYHDVLCVVGMNRIRARYLELAPELEPLFVMGTTDDVAGIARTMASNPGLSLPMNLFAASPVQVAVLNAVLVGVMVALAAVQVGATTAVAFGFAILGFVAVCVLFAWHTRRLLRTAIAGHQPLFPAPGSAPR